MAWVYTVNLTDELLEGRVGGLQVEVRDVADGLEGGGDQVLAREAGGQQLREDLVQGVVLVLQPDGVLAHGVLLVLRRQQSGVLHEQDVIGAVHVDHRLVGTQFEHVRGEGLQELVCEHFGDEDALGLDDFVELVFVE
jgi:hypothetical protein